MTAQTLECEVLIVGGGPAGLSVAATLPDHVSTIIVHQDAEIGKPVRTSGGCWLDDVEPLAFRLNSIRSWINSMYIPTTKKPIFRSKITSLSF
ncbi:FAD-dependent monooxygenase [bacterium]|nr:FAD-dependent monooxygenase [bacterium]